MKLNVNRETTIGLSVLLVLLVILGVVAVRRFLRPSMSSRGNGCLSGGEACRRTSRPPFEAGSGLGPETGLVDTRGHAASR